MTKNVILILLLVVSLLIAGCASGQRKVEEKPFESAKQSAAEAARTKPLVFTFVIAAALSVLALFNGSKSAGGFLAASLFGLGLSLSVANFPKQIGFVTMCVAGGWFIRSVLWKEKGFWSLKPKIDKLIKRRKNA